MPPGIPVAAVAIGKAGAQNAGVLAAQILAVADAALKNKLDNYRKKLAQSVSEKDTKLQSMGLDKYIEMQKENTRK
jgi:phosphoribosylcarboxyaminoimidazole (NCAIR) mutase